MNNSQLKKLSIVLFVFLFGQFLYEHGWKYVSIKHIDFPSFYWAAKLTFAFSISPYQSNVFKEAETLLGQRIFPYLYPPPSLFFFFPFSLTTYEVAKDVMLVINLLAIPPVIYLLLFKVIDLSHEQSFIALPFLVVYILSFNPIVVTLWHGQINLLVLFLLCLTWYAIRENHPPVIIALPLAAAILLKTYPVILIPFLLVKRKYISVAWIFVFMIFAFGASYILLPHDLWTDWLSNVLPTGGYGQVPFDLFSPAVPGNYSINGFTSRLFLENEFTATLLPSPWASRVIPYLLALGVVAVTGIVSWLASTSFGDKLIDFELSMFFLAMVLIAPLSWEHHLVLLLPVMVLAISKIVFSEEKRVLRLLVGFVTFLIAWQVPFDSPILTRGLLTLALSLKFYGILVLWAVMTLMIVQSLRNYAAQRYSPQPVLANH